MGQIFSPENVGQLFAYHYISGTLEHIYQMSNGIILRTMVPNT